MTRERIEKDLAGIFIMPNFRLGFFMSYEHIKIIAKYIMADRVLTAQRILGAGEHNCMTGSSTEGEMKQECELVIAENTERMADSNG